MKHWFNTDLAGARAFDTGILRAGISKRGWLAKPVFYNYSRAGLARHTGFWYSSADEFQHGFLVFLREQFLEVTQFILD